MHYPCCILIQHRKHPDTTGKLFPSYKNISLNNTKALIRFGIVSALSKEYHLYVNTAFVEMLLLIYYDVINVI